MPLPVQDVERELTHTRRVRFEGYKRADGLWDIEAHLSDIKNHDYHLKTGVRRAGQPIHEMWLRLTIDRNLTIMDAAASMDALPYPGGCEKITPGYRKLIGLSLAKDFRKKVGEILGGTKGCTHLTEMLSGMPTAAIQSFAGEMKEEREDGRKPFQLDQCHALETTTDTVKEWYAGMVVDRGTQKVVLMASSGGGMDIEEVAAKAPERIHKVFIDPAQGLGDVDADEIAAAIGIPDRARAQGRALFKALYKCFDATDASLAEINPLILTGDGRVVALDAKFNFDDNALFRHPEIVALRDLDEEDPAEVEASRHELNYIQLDGNIGCLVNGAGLAMATMDIIKFYGGSPANFLDVGGGATTEKVTEAFKIMLRKPSLKAILVNIFGGIMRCDVIATALVEASKAVSLRVPLVVRLEGTNVELGKKILADSGLPIISAKNMAEAAQKAVAAAKAKK